MDSNNVTWAKPKITGAVFVAPLKTDLPTDAKTNLGEAFKSLGYTSDDGIENDNSMETDTIKAWGGDIVANILKEKKDTFTFTLIETLNIDVLGLVTGKENVDGDLKTGIKVTSNMNELPNQIFVLEMILKGGVLKRIVIPNGKVTKVDKVSYKDDGISGYGITITAFPVNGNTHYEYIVGKGE